MLASMTRQDLLNATTDARNKIIERLVTKYDVQAAADAARDRILNNLNAMHIENQALMRQANAQRDQLWRKTTALEAQLFSLQQEVRTLTQAVNRLYELQVPSTPGQK
jgi:hypothetical protein